MKAEELRHHWEAAAPRWRANRAFVRRATEPVTRALLAAAGPRSGERWLDVASGVGDPAADLAQRVGKEGLVVVSDLVAAMAAMARDAIGAAGEASPAVAAAAEAPPFGPGVFDGLSCRYGAMFFADPAAALAALREVLRPGGRGVFAVWGAREGNPFFREVNEAVRGVVPDAPAPEPDEPHVFRFSPPGKLAALLESSGWRNVEEHDLPFEMAAPLDAGSLWLQLRGLSRELDELATELPPERADALRADIEARLGRWIDDDGLRLPARARIVVASPSGAAS